MRMFYYNIIDITFLKYFRILIVVSNLESRCVGKQIGHVFILKVSDSSSVVSFDFIIPVYNFLGIT